MAITVQGDLSHEGQVQDMVDRSLATLGNLSFVVNLASDYPRVPLPLLDSVAWDHAMGTAKGSYLLAVHAARAMSLNHGTNARPHRPLWRLGRRRDPLP